MATKSSYRKAGKKLVYSMYTRQLGSTKTKYRGQIISTNQKLSNIKFQASDWSAVFAFYCTALM